MQGLVCQFLTLYYFVLIARIILSWFPIAPGGALAGIFGFIYAVTEPVLGPIRRVLPPIGVGGMGLDLSPIILFFGLGLLRSSICS